MHWGCVLSGSWSFGWRSVVRSAGFLLHRWLLLWLSLSFGLGLGRGQSQLPRGLLCIVVPFFCLVLSICLSVSLLPCVSGCGCGCGCGVVGLGLVARTNVRP